MSSEVTALEEQLACEVSAVERLEQEIAALKEQLRFEAAECALAGVSLQVSEARFSDAMSLVARAMDRAVRAETERDTLKAGKS